MSTEQSGLHFDWRIIANGRLYRLVMRAMHRFGWCYPELVPVEPGYVWCHWCGMRGRRALRSGSPAHPPEGAA